MDCAPRPLVGSRVDSAVVFRSACTQVLAVAQGVRHQLTHVLVGYPVEHLVALLAGGHEPDHPQLGEMLGHCGEAFAHRLGELVDRKL